MNKKFFKEIKDQRNKSSSKTPNFSDELFKSYDNTLWPNTNLESAEGAISLSEKSLILDSLNHYISDKFEESKDETLTIPGGKVKKVENKSLTEYSSQEMDESSLKNFCDQNIEPKSSEKRYSTKLQTGIDILFVSDSFKPNSEVPQDMNNAFLGETIPYFFNGEACSLFSNMAKAMNISEQNMAITSPSYSIDEEEKDSLEVFYQDIAFYNPKIIISLGAKTVKILLKERKRIADVHGQLFKRDLLIAGVSRTLTIMPLFHPGFLVANPNMKKAAWIDLQKAMKLI